MKLITLNTWGGRAGRDLLLSFFPKYEQETDVFCLQEIWSAPHDHLEGYSTAGKPLTNADVATRIMQDICGTLSNFKEYFRPHFTDHYGIMTMVNKKIRVQDEGEVYVHKEKGYFPKDDLGKHARNIQWLKLENDGKLFAIINFHGLWNGQGKGDSDDRILQSQNIINFLKTIQGEYILCGDFNLLPDTQSLKMFEEFGLRNLIKEYGITSTRTSFYKPEVRYADYVFVSPGVKVNDFRVLPDEVSDHNALMLDFDI